MPIFNNVVEPTHCNPYTTAAQSLRDCPRNDLIDIAGEVKNSIVISFSFSTPEFNYKCLLTEGSDEIWEVDFVENGELKRIAGKVKSFEYWNSRHISLSTYYANGVKPKDSKIVVKLI